MNTYARPIYTIEIREGAHAATIAVYAEKVGPHGIGSITSPFTLTIGQRPPALYFANEIDGEAATEHEHGEIVANYAPALRSWIAREPYEPARARQNIPGAAPYRRRHATNAVTAIAKLILAIETGSRDAGEIPTPTDDPRPRL